ncbi:MAG: hypothetical protein P4L84_05555 [Isosphaeraceae bacterium]|nr:hypothetical protein [Isosphaeraceae bacterium]
MNPDAHTTLPAPWDRLPRLGLMAGGAGLLLSLLGAFAAPGAVFPSYLVAFLFWVNISLGCLCALLLHYLVGGAWGFLIRRPLEAAVMTIPLMALLFLPLLLGLHQLYPWSRPEVVAADHALQHKSAYLNVQFFVVRAAIYFGLWSLLAGLLRWGSGVQDRTKDPRATWRLQAMSAPGLVLTFLAITFAMIDWGMSIEPHWYSTIYGAMLLVGGGLSALAAMIITASSLSRVEPLTVMAKPDPFHDLGNLLLAFTMLWAYMSFSQFLIIWSGNLTEEIPWYLRRSEHGWRWLALLLMVFHFFVPFFLLLFRVNKRVSQNLWRVAALLLLMQWLNDIWLVIPAFPKAGWFTPVFLVAALVGIGGLWVSLFSWLLAQRSLLPQHDPLLEEVLAHQGEHH